MAGRSTKKKEPVERLKAWTGSGTVTVSIWQNENSDRPNYSVTVQRSYKKEGEWNNSDFLFHNDILAAAHLMGRAFDLISKWTHHFRYQIRPPSVATCAGTPACR